MRKELGDHSLLEVEVGVEEDGDGGGRGRLSSVFSGLGSRVGAGATETARLDLSGDMCDLAVQKEPANEEPLLEDILLSGVSPEAGV